MAAPKIPVPVDQPLSKAYLREFKGWSTAYPPGMSDPASLRVMHNCLVDVDAGLRIRPGLRAVVNPAHAAALPGPIIGSFEHFWYSSGVKALLFAIKRDDYGFIEFRVAKWNPTTKLFDIETTESRFGATKTLSSSTTYIKWVQINNRVFALPETTNPLDTWLIFDVGSESGVRLTAPVDLQRPSWTSADRPDLTVPDDSWFGTLTPYAERGANPTPRTPDLDTLVSIDDGNNVYYAGFFYTFANDIGESAPSQVATLSVRRPWYAWELNYVSTGTAPEDSSDQIVVTIPSDAWSAAKDAGARECRVYCLLWSESEGYPAQGQMIAVKPVTTNGSNMVNNGENWVSLHPMTSWRNELTALPSGDDYFRELSNSSTPRSAANALVAGDRIFTVYNKAEVSEGARIRWSGNMQGEYINFSPAVGGGLKTLTSGNLYRPVSVKLWQNPQSVDTVIVLCEGLDGEGTSYYMSPNTELNTLSQSIIVMGSEETTATPGTVSPYGCEVLNNALYHPLDNNIMKSTATNYNINHSLIADSIQNMWRAVPLEDKRKVVSSQLDSSLYYLVRSPASVAWSDDTTSNGNQVWVCDTGLEGAWSVWDVPGTSLRKLEVEGQLFMSITYDRSIYVFDPEKDNDDRLVGTEWKEVGIQWEIETNTQGANNAHDAWAYVQQLEVVFGNFTGECEYGIRGVDVNGKDVEISKTYRSPQERSHDPLVRYDQMDYLRIERTLREWTFFWRSLPKPKRRTYGSVSYVQYRYTPATVNVGYAHGTVQSFEYGKPTPMFFNGVAVPFADTRMP